jgi:predicted RNA binding protein YcfA (HicA-like mRNA interferase family)
MAFTFSQLRHLTGRDIVRALEQDGFRFRRQEGSHARYHHADGRRVAVSYHKSSDTFAPKTLRTMIEKQAQWTEDDLRRLRLLK